MRAYMVTMVALLGLTVTLVSWLLWTGRRDLRWYRAWRGGRWGLVRDRASWGIVLRWAPESEIQEGEHVLEWETWRTRVRGRGER